MFNKVKCFSIVFRMDKASLSPSSLSKHMFGDCTDEVCEVLTPSQCVNSTEPVRHTTWRRRCPTEPPPPSSDTAAPVVTFIPPASKLVITWEDQRGRKILKARPRLALLRHLLLASQSGIGASASTAAPTPLYTVIKGIH